MNKVIMMGRLCKDPEVRASNTTTVAKFSIAVDRRFKKDETDFFNCVAFGKQAEFIEKWVLKGTKVAIVGALQNNNWEKDGIKHYDVQIVIDEVEFAEKKNLGIATSNAPSDNIPKAADDGFMIPDDISDLPFA